MAGYTLVELLIGLFILSLLSLITYVRLKPGLEHGKVNGAASVLAIDFQYAQQLAAQQRKPVVVIMTSATRSVGGTFFFIPKTQRIQYNSCNIRRALQYVRGFAPVSNGWVDNWGTY